MLKEEFLHLFSKLSIAIINHNRKMIDKIHYNKNSLLISKKTTLED